MRLDGACDCGVTICWCHTLLVSQIRVMPNTPCLIGQCASAYVTGNMASEEDSMKTFSLMSAVGQSHRP